MRHTRRAVEESVGEPLEAYFDGGFAARPSASGSIAQVHFATRRGEALAVKVRHPRVAYLLSLDSTLMVKAAELVDRVPSLAGLRLSETVAQFSATLAAQAHLDHEAEALVNFRKKFRGRRWRDVRFPRPVSWSEAVLIETYEQGTLVNTLGAYRRNNGDDDPEPPFVDGAFLVHRGEDIYLKMLLDDGVMHADLHPGNLLYCAGEAGRRQHLVLVDAGMVAVLSRHERDAFVGLIESLGASDARTAARCVRSFSPANAAMTAAEARAFDDDLSALFSAKCRGYGTGVDFGDVVRGVLTLVRVHNIRVGANFATLIVNALCLDGMAANLQPGYSVLDGARPLLSAHRWLCGARLRGLTGPFGKFAFKRLCLPVCWRLKALGDKRPQFKRAQRRLLTAGPAQHAANS